METASQLPAEFWGLIQPFSEMLAAMGVTGLFIAYLLVTNFFVQRRADRMNRENAELAKEVVGATKDTTFALQRLTDSAIRGDFSRVKLPSEAGGEA